MRSAVTGPFFTTNTRTDHIHKHILEDPLSHQFYSVATLRGLGDRSCLEVDI